MISFLLDADPVAVTRPPASVVARGTCDFDCVSIFFNVIQKSEFY